MISTGNMSTLFEDHSQSIDLMKTIAKRYGTPVFIASETIFRRCCRDFLHDFRCGKRNIISAYSYKTNNLKAFCTIAHQEGLCAEVVSASELDMALSLGLKGKQIYYNGPYKPEKSLQAAVSHSVAIHVDSIPELDAIAAIAHSLKTTARIALRLTPSIADQGGLVWSKFGFSEKDGEFDAALARITSTPHLRLEGLHMHIGTNLTDSGIYKQASEQLARLACRAEQHIGYSLRYLDIGGGFSTRSNAVPLAVHPEEWCPLSISDLSWKIARVLDRTDPEMKWDLVVEPGRVITESTMAILSRVVSIKERDGRKLVILDTGTNILPTAYYTGHLLSFPGKILAATDTVFDFHGPLCTQYDIIATEVKAPELSTGDFVLIQSTGAYAFAFSSQFTGPRPAIVMLDHDNFSLVREAEPDTILWQYDEYNE